MRNGIILALRSEGMTLREIGRRINITNDSGHRVLIRFKHTLSMNHMTGSGRPRKTTIRDDAMIIGEVKKDRFVTSRRIKNNLPQILVSEKTIRRQIFDIGIFEKSYTKEHVN